MPFSTLLSGPFTNLAFTGKAVSGVSAPASIIFPADNLPASFQEWNFISMLVIGNNITMNSPLYWRVRHITTDDSDFVINQYVGISGTTNMQKYDGDINGVYRTYGTFYLSLKNDGIPEGPQSFVVEFRTGSQSGPLIGTGKTITITDYP